MTGDPQLAGIRRALTMLFVGTLLTGADVRPLRPVGAVLSLIGLAMVAVALGRLRPVAPNDESYRFRLRVARATAWVLLASAALAELGAAGFTDVIDLVAGAAYFIFLVLAMQRMARIIGAARLVRTWSVTMRLTLSSIAFVMALIADLASGGGTPLLGLATIFVLIASVIQYLAALWITRSTVARAVAAASARPTA